MRKFNVTTWHNGSPNHQTGSGFGLKLKKTDRDQHVQRRFKEAIVQMEGEAGFIAVNIDKQSFWNDTCIELVSREIGLWLLRNGYGSWEKGKPYKLELQHTSENRFFLKKNN
jgi:hypothetical protein